MKISEIGEFGLIDRLAEMAGNARDARQAAWQRLVTGIGDDTAVWEGDTNRQLATIDSLIENVHFTLDTISWSDLGWKALAVNLSDLAAMGGEPRYALVSLALPGNTEVDDVIAFYQGMLALAGEIGVAIVGGDTCQSATVMITITVFGKAGTNGVLSRAAARPGDLVAVTGYPGTAAAGLEMLKEKLDFSRETTDLLREAFCRPRPRITEGQQLLAGGVKAAIDISDGLLADLGHICRQSGVGARIEVDRLPRHPLVLAAFGDKATALSLAGGEDYDLLFTAGADIIRELKEAITGPVSIIGEITAENPGEVMLIDGQGNRVSCDAGGWEHFSSNRKDVNGQ